eukprot:2353666-Amphidinium_carterae.1
MATIRVAGQVANDENHDIPRKDASKQASWLQAAAGSQLSTQASAHSTYICDKQLRQITRIHIAYTSCPACVFQPCRNRWLTNRGSTWNLMMEAPAK